MLRFLGRRTVQAAATLFAVIVLTFFLARATGKPAAMLLPDTATQADVDALNAELGFDRPLREQFSAFLADLMRFDVGDSYREPGTDAMSIIAARLPATIELAVNSFVSGVLLALVVVLAIHVTGSGRLRSFFIWGGSLRNSMPDYFFSLLLVLVFSVSLGWLPSLGRGGTEHLVLPVVALATGQFMLYLRLFDNAMTDQLGADYVRTARAQGAAWPTIVVRDLLPNSVLPVLAMAGINLGSLLGGTVIVEMVFSWPGIGQALLEAVNFRDFPIVQAGLIIVAAVFVIANLMADVLATVIDPRVRLQ